MMNGHFKLLLLALFSLQLSVAYAASDGYVVKAESSTVYLDWGKSSGVHAGDRFSIYRSGAALQHPVTREILGHVEDHVAAGRIDRIDEKFSVATLEAGAGLVKAGDRTRAMSSSVEAVAPSTETDPSGALAPSVAALHALWRSEPLPGAVTGITCADLQGDGHTDLIVSYKDKIEAFQIVDQKLTSIGVYQHRLYRHWLSVEAGDPARGHGEIFANAWFDAASRPHVVVLRWESGKFKAVADLDGFVRSIDRADGHKTLAWQTMSRNREKHFNAPSELVSDHGTYKPGPSLGLSALRDDQLQGFTLGDWDHDQKEDLALLERGEKLRVISSSTSWNSPDSQGGTQNDFTADNDVHLSFTPRLAAWHPATGSSELLAPHNIAELPLHLFQMKFFKTSEITAWSWSGHEMKIDWQQALPGYLSDYTIVDALGQSTPQLIVAVSAPGDKTVLLAYRLP